MELAAVCLLVIIGVSAIAYAGTRQQKRDKSAAGDAGAPIMGSRDRGDDSSADDGGSDGGGGGAD